MAQPTYVQFQWSGLLHQQDVMAKARGMNPETGWPVRTAKEEVVTSIEATFTYPERIEILDIRYIGEVTK